LGFSSFWANCRAVWRKAIWSSVNEKSIGSSLCLQSKYGEESLVSHQFNIVYTV
jgi:hypothetical protein